jgi:hypothetical protein
MGGWSVGCGCFACCFKYVDLMLKIFLGKVCVLENTICSRLA